MKAKGSLRRLGVVLAATVAAGAFTAGVPAGEQKGGRLHIEAAFNSILAPPSASCQPPKLRTPGVGTAKGTHLGANATAGAEECSDPVTRPGFFLVHGLGWFTAKNGDTLYIEYNQVSVAPDFTRIPVTIHDEGEFVVTGGTGRFAGATGGGTLFADGVISFDFATGQLTAKVTAQYDGRIVLGNGH